MVKVIGEKSGINHYYSKSHIERFAKELRNNPPEPELKFLRFLDSLNKGVLKGQYNFQHIVSGKWIVDFFFPCIRLAIEIDGSVHATPEQKKLDLEKEKDCKRMDITLIRITNKEVYGNEKILISKLRKGWREALDRENKIIGKVVIKGKPNPKGKKLKGTWTPEEWKQFLEELKEI